MPVTQNQPNWHLIYTKPTQEMVAQRELENQGYITYLPKVTSHKTHKGNHSGGLSPLFPRYLFIRLTAGVDNWSPINFTRGVNSLVRFGIQPALISDEAISLIKARENKDGLHTIKPASYRKGDSVRVTNGPFSEYEAIFAEKRPYQRALVLMDILGSKNRVEVTQACLSPA